MTARTVARLALGAVLLAGCGRDNFRDVEGVPSKDPDAITLWNNVDGNPNVVRICLDGVAFATTTRQYGDAIMRVPEWDAQCPPAGARR